MYLTIHILHYNGIINYTWINYLRAIRHDIDIIVHEYKDMNVGSYGEAYNQIMLNNKTKYFMLLDNIDFIDVDLFNLHITPQLLAQDFQMIKSNQFVIIDANNKLEYAKDDFTGTNDELEQKLLNRGIFPYFFGSRIYNTDFIRQNNIVFNNTDIFNDVYPNVLLIRNLTNYKIVDSRFYCRKRLRTDDFTYKSSDLREMIESLLKLNIDKQTILLRLVDSYNYSVTIRGNQLGLFTDAIKGIFNYNEFLALIDRRNNEAIYNAKSNK